MSKRRRRRNPNQFTADEIITAMLLVTEGTTSCVSVRRNKTYCYPQLRIPMCDREALEPAEKVSGTKIGKQKMKKVECPAHLYPPDGKGIWLIAKTGKGAEQII